MIVIGRPKEEQGMELEKCIEYLDRRFLSKENVANDADITLKISADNRMQNYSGMSGSQVIYQNNIIGILTEQANELSDFENRAIDLKMISMKKVRKMLDTFNIDYIEGIKHNR